MEVFLAVLAAGAATGLVIDLVAAYLVRPRPHIGVWVAALSLYAAASWMLVIGLGFGWSSWVFRVFYGFGAILNVPFLGVGSAYLVLGKTSGRRLLEWFSVAGLFALFVTFTAPFIGPLASEGLPAGSDVFADIASVGPAGPRFYALVFNIAGTLLLVGLAAWSVVRYWSSNRRLVTGNGLIVFGGLFPAFGGSLFAVGETSAFALSLFFGAGFLWSGFRVAAGARR